MTAASDIPTARHIQRRTGLLLAVVPLIIGTIWGFWHLIAVSVALTGHGNPLALTWFAAFGLLWWVILAWAETPRTVTPRKRTWLDRLVVTVSVPAYNEDPQLLQKCLGSLLTQTRRPNRIHVVDDGSTSDYPQVRTWFYQATEAAGVWGTWRRTENRGKRHAQMRVLAHDDGDIFVTLDSDSVLERHAIEEGLIPFADPEIHSVAGMVVVWNSRANFLTRLTCMLYTPFTRGFRSAQSVLGRVMVNSGTLAFYRGSTIRRYAGSYENEQFMGRAMQMNDDSMMTFYGLLAGRTVHQPSSIAFTIVPERMGHYLRQQLRWMRGTFIRTWWWIKYMPVRDPAFWMPLGEFVGFLLSIAMAVVLLTGSMIPAGRSGFLRATLLVGLLINYTIALRWFVIVRDDESVRFRLAVFALAPVAGVWRLLILRPLMIYAMLTFWKVGTWGTRTAVEPTGSATAAGA